MPGPSETKRALIVVKTYPVPAKSGVEVSCTAAITDQGEWLRLFPVPFRFLDPDQRFSKYQWVDVGVTKSRDTRPESYKLERGAIKVVSTVPPTREWQLRKDVVFPLRSHSMCGIRRTREQDGHPTLGFFRPKTIERLIIEPDSNSWSESQLGILRQEHLFVTGPQEELVKVPFKFSYAFRCEDSECNGHKMICTDWEMGESWRRWSRDYGDRWEEKFRQRYEREMIEKSDTHFYVGTIKNHPNTWIIVGLFYPPKTTLGLFD